MEPRGLLSGLLKSKVAAELQHRQAKNPFINVI